jgi:hypothetical protein
MLSIFQSHVKWYCRKIRFSMTKKNAQIGFRISGDVKRSLEQIARREGRSLAQICDVFLRIGISTYEKEGSKYVQRFWTSLRDE